MSKKGKKNRNKYKVKIGHNPDNDLNESFNKSFTQNINKNPKAMVQKQQVNRKLLGDKYCFIKNLDNEIINIFMSNIYQTSKDNLISDKAFIKEIEQKFLIIEDCSKNEFILELKTIFMLIDDTHISYKLDSFNSVIIKWTFTDLVNDKELVEPNVN